jgi:hypothetical protein
MKMPYQSRLTADGSRSRNGRLGLGHDEVPVPHERRFVGPACVNSREATFAFERKMPTACIRDKEVACDALKATSASMDP